MLYACVTSAQIQINATIIDLSCNATNGPADGVIDVTVTGGTPGYTYAWTTVDGSGLVLAGEDQTELSAGTYDLVVTDATGATERGTFTLTEPDAVALVEVLNQPDCNVNNGAFDGDIDITVTGGIWPYTYNWSGPNTVVADDDQTGLGAGTYNVTVTDMYGCSVQANYTLVEPAPISLLASTSDLDCNSAIGTANGQIDITVSGGAGASEYDYNYTWESTDGNGLVATDADQSGLSAGTYEVTVTDANACTATESYTLTEPNSSLRIETEIKDNDCQPGDASLTITAYEGTAPYTVTWTSATGGDLAGGDSVIAAAGGSTTFTGLEAYQEYTFSVTDANGCAQEFSHTPGITAVYELGTPSLCMVSSDPMTGYNNILWEDPANMDHITQFNIYREGSATGAYELVGSLAAGDENRFVDETVDPSIQAYKYQLTASDICGLESEVSNTHKTIHLVVNQGLNSRINLEWDTYEGLNYDQVVIYRGSSAADMEELISLPSTVGSFTDTNAPTGMLVYQIAITQEIECEIGKALFSVRSNVATIGDSDDLTVLSIDNLSFSAALRNENNVVLRWSYDNYSLVSYNLERSMDLHSWTSLEKMEVDESIKSYSYTDSSPEEGVNYYRLQALDVHNEVLDRKIVSQRVSEEIDIKLYPNPVGENRVVKFSAPYGEYLVTIYNRVGQVIGEQEISASEDSFSLNQLIPGLYYCTVSGGNVVKTFRLAVPK